LSVACGNIPIGTREELLTAAIRDRHASLWIQAEWWNRIREDRSTVSSKPCP
jgi:hypothetical protein